MTSAHRLDPLLRPRSIAVVGASDREASGGYRTLHNLLQGGYRGRLCGIHPRHRSVLGVDCHPDFASLPAPVEHAILTVGDAYVEAALDAAIAHGVRAVTMMSSLVLENDATPLLRDRIAARVREAGLLVCGANGMGFCNFTDHVRAYGFVTREHGDIGNITMISHSGSGLCGIMDADERLRFNLVVSPGQELSVTMADYLDFALDQPETRVVGLFMETVRDPQALIAAFDRARRRRVPIVALKVGRTELAARMAVSHTGAIAGDDGAYEALFDRYGIQRVRDMDELATTLIMFAQPHPIGDGGLVTLHDSGGERQLLIDLANDAGVPLTTLSDDTVRRLEQLLDPGLPAINPLDGWSAGGPDANATMAECIATMLCDNNAAIGAVVHDRIAGGRIHPDYQAYLRAANRRSGKPVFLVANRQGTGADPLVQSLTDEGLPVLDGLASFLTGAGALLRYRDYLRRDDDPPPMLDADLVAGWRLQLHGGSRLDVRETSILLAAAGLPVNPVVLVDSVDAAVLAWKHLGQSAVLKTADPAIAHKTDVGGVILDVDDAQKCRDAYSRLAKRFGPSVAVSPMIRVSGVEMILGMLRDPQFGPLVMIGIGGVHAELLGDVRFALAPFGPATARRLVDALRLRPLLDGVRGAPAVDITSFCDAAAALSVLAASLGDVIDEIELNPVIVHASGCVAVDSLISIRGEQSTRSDA